MLLTPNNYREDQYYPQRLGHANAHNPEHVRQKGVGMDTERIGSDEDRKMSWKEIELDGYGDYV